MKEIYFLLTQLWCCSVIINCFNLDFEYTILKDGPKGSLFGYSVAEHQSNTGQSWMLVGAPRGNNSFLPAGKDYEWSGTVFKCDASTLNRSCTEIKFDSAPIAVNGLGQNIESKKDQWFGVSLKSGGKNKDIMSCAHRYKYYGSNANYRLLEGKCWSVSSDFKEEIGMEPCRTKNSDKKKTPDFKLYGQCEAGISLDILPETADGSQPYLVGAAGAMEFAGRVFKIDTEEVDTMQTKLPESGYINSYFGYSVAYGNFFSKAKISIATGGPRHNSFGQVLIYSDKTVKDAEDGIVMNTILQALPNAGDILQIASGFGISLCSIDSNANGFSELIIGAPFYASTPVRYNQGLVYVYEKNNTHLALVKTLKGAIDYGVNKGVNANFGYAVANAGDINLDNYEDLIVGAPNENGNTGTVYIYNGFKLGLPDKPTQIILATSLHSGLDSNLGLLGFGRSFGVGLDLDNNGYKDVLVGSHLSEQAVLLRSRPVINMTISMSFNPIQLDATKKECKINGKDTTCFKIEFCYSFTEPSGKLYNKPGDKVSIKYVITADPTVRRPRLNFNNGANVLSFIKDTNKSKTCDTIKDVHLIYNRDGSIQEYPDITFQLDFSLPYETDLLAKPKPSSSVVTNLDTYPTIESTLINGAPQLSHKINYKLLFKRECDICIPDLSIKTSENKTLRLGRKTFKFNVTIENEEKDPAYGVSLNFTLPQDITLEHLVESNGAIKYCVQSSCKYLYNKFGKDKKVVIGVVLNTEKVTPTTFNKMSIKVSSVNKENEDTQADNEVNINFELKVEADIDVLLGKSTQNVQYAGGVKGESALKSLDQVGARIEHKYVIQNNGPDTLPAANFTINWPVELLSGKHLLYLVDVTVTRSKKTKCVVPASYKNELKLQGAPSAGAIAARYSASESSDSSSSTNSRSRRAVTTNSTKPSTTTPTTVPPTIVPTTKTVEKTRKKDGRILNCTSARCISIKCTIGDLISGQVESISVQSRLWKASLSLDYYGDVITVVSNAQVDISSDLSYINDPNWNNNHNELFTNIIPVFAPKGKEKIATWIIALSVIAGAVLLALMIFGLYKLGFFKRNKSDKYRSKSDDKSEKALLGKHNR